MEDLAQPDVQKIIQNDYDLALISWFFNDCFLGVIYQKNVSTVLKFFLNFLLYYFLRECMSGYSINDSAVARRQVSRLHTRCH